MEDEKVTTHRELKAKTIKEEEKICLLYPLFKNLSVEDIEAILKDKGLDTINPDNSMDNIEQFYLFSLDMESGEFLTDTELEEMREEAHEDGYEFGRRAGKKEKEEELGEKEQND